MLSYHLNRSSQENLDYLQIVEEDKAKARQALEERFWLYSKDVRQDPTRVVDLALNTECLRVRECALRIIEKWKKQYGQAA